MRWLSLVMGSERSSRFLVVDGRARRGAAIVVAAALVALVGCQRSLAGAPCTCASGWVCCLPVANVCVRPTEQCPAPMGARDAATDADAAAHATTSPDAAPDAGGDGALSADGHVAIAPPTPAAPTSCTIDGWCWTHPLPTGEAFVQVRAPSPTDVWLLGQAGTVLRWNGSAWSALQAPTPTLWALWVSGPQDVWLGAEDGIWHWDGHDFRLEPPTSIASTRPVYAIWGLAADDVWAVGAWIWHWDGQRWSPYTPPDLIGPLQAVWGSAHDDVYAGVTNPIVASQRVIHWDGDTWSTVASFGADQIVGTGPRDVLASSANEIRRWDGTAWTPLPGDPPLALFPLAGARIGALDPALNLVAWDGSAWSPLSAAGRPAPAPFRSLAAASPFEVWAAGVGGAAARWDGTSWSTRLPQIRLTSDSVRKVTSGGERDVWAVAGGSLLHWDGSEAGWQTALASDRVGGGILDLWASGPDDLWLLGADDLLHRWNAGVWTTEDVPLRGADGAQMTAISGTADDNVWIVRGTDTILHWDGNGWTGSKSDRKPLTDVWAFGPQQAWVAGEGLSLWNNGTKFASTLPSGVSSPIGAVTGSAADDVWAIAGHSVIHYDGHAWSPVRSYSHDVIALSVRARDDVWIAAPTDTLITRVDHGAGQTWTSSVAPVVLHDIWAAPDGTTWMAGEHGALLRRAR